LNKSRIDVIASAKNAFQDSQKSERMSIRRFSRDHCVLFGVGPSTLCGYVILGMALSDDAIEYIRGSQMRDHYGLIKRVSKVPHSKQIEEVDSIIEERTCALSPPKRRRLSFYSDGTAQSIALAMLKGVDVKKLRLVIREIERTIKQQGRKENHDKNHR
jgi:hypothetical protein